MFERLLLIMFMLPALLQGQDRGMVLSLAEAQEHAILNNKTLQNARADVQLADAQIKEARGAGLPQIDGSMDYLTYFNYEFEFNVGGGTSEPPDINFALLDPGDFEILKIFDEMTGNAASSIIMGDQASANLQFSQLIFNGQYWTGLEMARQGKVLREKGVSLTELDIKEQVINTYYLTLITEELRKVMEVNKNNLLEMQKHTRNLFQAGLAESLDVDQIGINISQLENTAKAMERNLEMSYNMLRFLLGLDAGTPIQLSENLSDILSELESASLMTNNFEIEQNLNYQLLDIQEVVGEKSVEMQKWAFAPTLVGFYNYKKKILSTAFDLSPNHAAGFTMSIPILSGGTRTAQLAKARIELDKATRTKELVRDQLLLQHNQLAFNLSNALENYTTQKQNLEVAERVFQNITTKYRQGMISSLDLTQAHSNYLQAENNYLSSSMELLQSKLALDKLYNTL